MFLPYSKDLGQGITLEETDVGDNIEQSRLMHPIGQPHNLSRKQILPTLSFELLLHPLRVNFDNSLSRNSVVLVKSRFLLVFIAGDHLQIIGSEHFGVVFLDAVDEFDGSGVAVLSEEGDGHVACFDGLQNVVD